ncbi:hypothetical protein ACH5RR_015634 [Cinchona calisaya]|uniref:Uncharacterized protein n=1 Tax=Cinchona calisaya TaxID=153742 RepID=A0ABD2ZTN9_9GENT
MKKEATDSLGRLPVASLGGYRPEPARAGGDAGRRPLFMQLLLAATALCLEWEVWLVVGCSCFVGVCRAVGNIPGDIKHKGHEELCRPSSLIPFVQEITVGKRLTVKAKRWRGF